MKTRERERDLAGAQKKEGERNFKGPGTEYQEDQGPRREKAANGSDHSVICSDLIQFILFYFKKFIKLNRILKLNLFDIRIKSKFTEFRSDLI